MIRGYPPVPPGPCSAETRFQGIVTGGDGLWLGLDHHPCSAETRFQGIVTRTSHRPPRSGGDPTCSAETRFQGIVTGDVYDPVLGHYIVGLQC